MRNGTSNMLAIHLQRAHWDIAFEHVGIGSAACKLGRCTYVQCTLHNGMLKPCWYGVCSWRSFSPSHASSLEEELPAGEDPLATQRLDLSQQHNRTEGTLLTSCGGTQQECRAAVGVQHTSTAAHARPAQTATYLPGNTLPTI